MIIYPPLSVSIDDLAFGSKYVQPQLRINLCQFVKSAIYKMSIVTFLKNLSLVFRSNDDLAETESSNCFFAETFKPT
jgi:hypothetical protein